MLSTQCSVKEDQARECKKAKKKKIGKSTRGRALNYRQPRFSSPLPFPSGIFALLPTPPPSLSPFTLANVTAFQTKTQKRIRYRQILLEMECRFL